MKTAELTGAALDWAVAKCEGLDVDIDQCILIGDEYYVPSADWSQGGPIIEREKIATWLNGDDEWAATDGIKTATGDTPLIAAMRCYVASKLGDEIEIPKGLE